jgi:group I intron endonuclease
LATIYCIQNKINDKKYIGKNSSNNPNKRWNAHKRKLNKGIRENLHLQNTWNKYGEDIFAFFIIEEYEKKQAITREIYWINFFDTYKNGYNLTKGGDGVLGMHHSIKTKKNTIKN